MKPPLGPELCGSWRVWWKSHLSVDSSGNSHTAASLTSMSGLILLISGDLWLPSSLFPFLPPQIETWPWLCPTPTAHLQLFWCQLAAVPSSVCIHSSFSRVKTSGKHQSLLEAVFPFELLGDVLASSLTLAGVEQEPWDSSCPLQPQLCLCTPRTRCGPLLLFWGQIH